MGAGSSSAPTSAASYTLTGQGHAVPGALLKGCRRSFSDEGEIFCSILNLAGSDRPKAEIPGVRFGDLIRYDAAVIRMRSTAE
jgi:hypothetical protein